MTHKNSRGNSYPSFLILLLSMAALSRYGEIQNYRLKSHTSVYLSPCRFSGTIRFYKKSVLFNTVILVGSDLKGENMTTHSVNTKEVGTKNGGQTALLLQQFKQQKSYVGRIILREALSKHSNSVTFEEDVAVQGCSNLDFVVHFPNNDIAIVCKNIGSSVPTDQERLIWINELQLQLGILKSLTGRDTKGVIAAFGFMSGTRFSIDVEAA